MAAAVGINTAIDASDVLEQFSTLNNRKEVHEKKRKEKLGFFARLKRFFGRIFKKKEYRGLSTNGLSQRAKTCYKNTIKKEKEKKLTLLRDEVKTIEDTMLETLKNKKGKSKQNQLIEDTIELRAEALKLIAQKKAMALKKEYPEFEEKREYLVFSLN